VRRVHVWPYPTGPGRRSASRAGAAQSANRLDLGRAAPAATAAPGRAASARTSPGAEPPKARSWLGPLVPCHEHELSSVAQYAAELSKNARATASACAGPWRARARRRAANPPVERPQQPPQQRLAHSPCAAESERETAEVQGREITAHVGSGMRLGRDRGSPGARGKAVRRSARLADAALRELLRQHEANVLANSR